MTNWKALIAARPKGDTTAQLVAVYGNPIGPHSVEHGDGTFDPDPAWRAANLVLMPVSDLPGFPKYQGSKGVTGVTVHRLVAPILIATFAELERRGLPQRRHQDAQPPQPLGSGAPAALR